MDDHRRTWNPDMGHLKLEDPHLREQLQIFGPHLAADSGGGVGLDGDAVTEAILEKSPLLIYVIDLDGRTLQMNRRMRDVSGYDVGDCPDGETLLSTIYADPDYRAVVRVIHDGWIDNRHVRDQVTLVNTRERGVRNVSWSTSRIKAGGATLGYIAMGVDVTEHKRIDQWARLQTGVLENLRDGVVVADNRGQVIALTGAVQRMLGYAADAGEGMRLDDLFTDDAKRGFLLEMDQALLDKGVYTEEAELIHRNGRPVPLEVTGLQLNNDQGRPIARLLTLREPEQDEFMHQMQDLGAITASFERKVAQLTEEVERRNREIEKRNNELEKRYAEIAEKDTLIREHEEQLQGLSASSGQVEADHAALVQKHETQAQTLEAHVRALAERDEAIVQRDQLIQAGHSEIQQLKDSLKGLEGNTANLSEDRERMEREIEERDQTIALLTTERSDLSTRVEEMEGVLDSRTSELQQVAGDAEGLALGLRQAREETNQQLLELERKHEKELNRIREELTRQADTERAVLKDTLESEARSLREQLEEAEAGVERARTESEETTDQARSELRVQKDEEVARVRKEMEDRVQNLTSSLVARVSELEGELEESASLHAEELAKLQADADEARTQLEAALETTRKEDAESFEKLRETTEREREAQQAEAEERLRTQEEAAEQARLDTIAEITRTKEEEAAGLRVQVGSLERKLARRREDLEAMIRDEYEGQIAAERERADGLADQLSRAADAGETHARTANAVAADIARIAETAIVVCGMDGRVVTWSAGATALDGRDRDAAVGKLLHGEVLQVEGFDWRQIVMQMTMGKRIRVPVLVRRADGNAVPALLEAVGVKDDQGRPAGFVEVLREMSAVARMEQQLFRERSRAVVGDLTAAIRGRVEGTADTLIKQGRTLVEWAEDLLRIALLNREGGNAFQIEELLRQVDLDAIERQLPSTASGLRENHRQLWNLGRDLRRYVDALSADEEDRYPVNQAVETAIQLALGAQPEVMVEREFGDVPPLLGRGGQTFPLLIQLITAAREAQPADPGAREIRIRTGRDEDQATVEISHPGAFLTADEATQIQAGFRSAVDPGPGAGGLAYASFLAGEAGGQLELLLDEERSTYKLSLPIDPRPPEDDEGEDSLDRFIADRDRQMAEAIETADAPRPPLEEPSMEELAPDEEGSVEVVKEEAEAEPEPEPEAEPEPEPEPETEPETETEPEAEA